MPSLLKCALALGSTGFALAADPEVNNRRLAFGTLTADPNNPTMSSLGGASGGMPFMMPGMMSGGGSGQMPMMSPMQEAEVTKDASEFMASATKAFLNKQNLPAEEMQCIQDGSSEIGGNLGRVAGEFAVVAKNAFGVNIPLPDGADPKSQASGLSRLDGASSVSDMVDQIQASHGGATASSEAMAQALAEADKVAKNDGSPNKASESRDTEKKKPVADPQLSFFYSGRRLQMLPAMPSSGGGVSSMMGPQSVPMVMELGVSIEQMTKEMHGLIGDCVHSDAKLAFREAGKNARDLDYVTGHFLANGADIVEELADSVMAYEHQDADKFGKDFGKAMRKVFLSSNTNGNLPEGLPGDAELGNVTSGLLRGFFGPGTFMDIKLAKDPKDPVHVDMQHCVKNNIDFFQQIWASTMYLYAQGAAGVGSAGAATSSLSTDEGKLQFGTMLGFTMMELPSAMGKCGIDDEQESMILDSVKSLGSGMDTKFELPNDKPSKKEMTNDLAKTVKEWSENNWYDFGKQLGALMQESTVKFYPSKYSIDIDGSIRKQFAQPQGNLALLLFLPTALVLAGFAIARKTRRIRSAQLLRTCEDEVDGGSRFFDRSECVE